MSDSIQVNMLGGLSIQWKEQRLDDSANRMRKVWLLLAYLIYCRNTAATQDHYLNLLQGSGNEESADPNGRLKAMFYRARALLDQLDGAAGHDWILRKNGTYAWNTDVPLELDVEVFEQLCREGASARDEELRLELFTRALALYRGDFLPKLSMEPWVMPLSAYYHRLYMDTAKETLTLLEGRSRWVQAADLCEKALKVDPYSETVYQHLMRCRIALGDRAGALNAYEEMSEALFSTFGVMPSDESRVLYREASREAETPTLPAGSLQDLLREPSEAKGAVYCEYDFFKLLYQVQARAIVRSGDVVHIALLSLHGAGQESLARRSLDRAMDNLQELLIANLRQGDVVTRCSISQMIVMLPQANYENSCKVCQRIQKAFARKYPHSPAEVRFSVHPLEPTPGAVPTL